VLLITTQKAAGEIRKNEKPIIMPVLGLAEKWHDYCFIILQSKIKSRGTVDFTVDGLRPAAVLAKIQKAPLPPLPAF